MNLRLALLLATVLGTASMAVPAKEVELLNVSYDPTREFYAEINAAVRRAVAGEDRRDAEHPGIARRLRQAGARGRSTASRPTW